MKKIEINVPHDQPVALAIAEAFKVFAESVNAIIDGGTAPAATTLPGTNVTTTLPPPAVTEPPPATAPALEGVELDSDGVPWDARIHAGSKLKLAKTQQWKKKKGLDKTVWQQVTDELKAAMAAPAPPPAATTAAPPPAATTAAPPPPAAAPAPPAPPAPVVDNTPVIYDVNGDHFTREQLIGAGWTDEQVDGLPVAESYEPLVFPVLLQHINTAVTSGNLTDARVQEVVNGAGVGSISLLAARPDLVQTVYEQLFGE
jgi:hypothetical protein